MAAHGARAYHVTLATLLALTGASFLASGVSFAGFDLAVALAIATVKASLVACFFMHLYGGELTWKLSLAAALAFITLLVGLMALDVATRPAPVLLPPAAG